MIMWEWVPGSDMSINVSLHEVANSEPSSLTVTSTCTLRFELHHTTCSGLVASLLKWAMTTVSTGIVTCIAKEPVKLLEGTNPIVCA